MKPLMLIDVDGVVTCQQSAMRLDVEQVVVGQEVYCFKPEVWVRIGWLIRHERIEAQWLTTWGDRAHDWEWFLGLPRLPVVQPYENREEWWKFTRVREIEAVTAGRKIVWIDDYIKEYRRVQDWVDDHDNVLGVSPSANTGLTTFQLEEIEAWL